MSAGNEATFKYDLNVKSSTIAIAIIPGADPIKRSEPPTPAVSANNTHRLGSVVLIISIAAAVKGILSNTAEKPPIATFPTIIRETDGVSVKSFFETISRIP